MVAEQSDTSWDELDAFLQKEENKKKHLSKKNIKLRRILLGFISICPLLYLIFFFSFIFNIVFTGISNQNVPSFSSFQMLFALHLIVVFLVLGLVIFYIVDIVRNKRISSEMKAVWIILLFLFNIIIMPVYWYLYIWKQ